MLALIAFPCIRTIATWYLVDDNLVYISRRSSKIKVLDLIQAIFTWLSLSINQEHPLSSNALESFSIGDWCMASKSSQSLLLWLFWCLLLALRWGLCVFLWVFVFYVVLFFIFVLHSLAFTLSKRAVGFAFNWSVHACVEWLLLLLRKLGRSHSKLAKVASGHMTLNYES